MTVYNLTKNTDIEKFLPGGEWAPMPFDAILKLSGKAHVESCWNLIAPTYAPHGLRLININPGTGLYTKYGAGAVYLKWDGFSAGETVHYNPNHYSSEHYF